MASLFGEVNEFKLSNFFDLDEADQTLFLYPHQLKVVEESKMKAVVKQCYFKGSHYLVKAAFEGRAILLDHDSELELNHEVCLDFLR